MKPSPDRVLYLSRVIAKKLKENLNLTQKADDDTVRRAIVRDLTEAYKELDAIEEKVRGSLAKRKNVSSRTRSSCSRGTWTTSSASTEPESKVLMK